MPTGENDGCDNGPRGPPLLGQRHDLASERWWQSTQDASALDSRVPRTDAVPAADDHEGFPGVHAEPPLFFFQTMAPQDCEANAPEERCIVLFLSRWIYWRWDVWIAANALRQLARRNVVARVQQLPNGLRGPLAILTRSRRCETVKSANGMRDGCRCSTRSSAAKVP